MERTEEEPNEVVGLDESFGVGFLADGQPFEGSNENPIRTAFDDASREVGDVRLGVVPTRHGLCRKGDETRKRSVRRRRDDEMRKRELTMKVSFITRSTVSFATSTRSRPCSFARRRAIFRSSLVALGSMAV